MSMTLWDRSVLSVWQPPPDTNASDAESGARHEQAPLLASAEAQALTLGEVFAWVGLAIWGGALVAFVVYDIARTYQHHHPVLHMPVLHKPGHKPGHRHSDPGRHQDAR